MNSVSEVRGYVRVNNGPLRMATLSMSANVERVVSISPVGDPKWLFSDDAGHVHARSVGTNPYPTLIRVPLAPPDEDGWSPEEMRCRICAAPVVPGTIPGPHESYLTGLYAWEVLVDCRHAALPADVGQEVSVVFTRGTGKMRFGIAIVSGVTMSSEGTLVLLVGTGELGEVAR